MNKIDTVSFGLFRVKAIINWWEGEKWEEENWEGEKWGKSGKGKSGKGKSGKGKSGVGNNRKEKMCEKKR